MIGILLHAIGKPIVTMPILPPTHAQLNYINHLCNITGSPAFTGNTRIEASRYIDKLKKIAGK